MRFKGTHTEAQEVLRKLIEEIEFDQIQTRTSATFEEYVDHYLEQRTAKKEAGSFTIKKQHDQFKAVKPHIGRLSISSITRQTLEKMDIGTLDGEMLSGRPSGGSYVNQIHDNLVLVFDAASKDGLLLNNPCSQATPPRMDTKPKSTLQRPGGDPRSRAQPGGSQAVRLSAGCHAQLAPQGDLRPVHERTWTSPAFRSIRHAIGSRNLKGTKTKAGTRILPLPDVICNALKMQMVAQASQFAKTNSCRKPEDGCLEQNPAHLSLPVMMANASYSAASAAGGRNTPQR